MGHSTTIALDFQSLHLDTIKKNLKEVTAIAGNMKLPDKVINQLNDLTQSVNAMEASTKSLNQTKVDASQFKELTKQFQGLDERVSTLEKVIKTIGEGGDTSPILNKLREIKTATNETTSAFQEMEKAQIKATSPQKKTSNVISNKKSLDSLKQELIVVKELYELLDEVEVKTSQGKYRKKYNPVGVISKETIESSDNKQLKQILTDQIKLAKNAKKELQEAMNSGNQKDIAKATRGFFAYYKSIENAQDEFITRNGEDAFSKTMSSDLESIENFFNEIKKGFKNQIISLNNEITNFSEQAAKTAQEAVDKINKATKKTNSSKKNTTKEVATNTDKTLEENLSEEFEVDNTKYSSGKKQLTIPLHIPRNQYELLKDEIDEVLKRIQEHIKPLEVKVALTSGLNTKKAQELADQLTESLDNIEDKDIKERVSGLIETLQKQFTKELHINFEVTGTDTAKKVIDQAIADLKKKVKKKENKPFFEVQAKLSDDSIKTITQQLNEMDWHPIEIGIKDISNKKSKEKEEDDEEIKKEYSPLQVIESAIRAIEKATKDKTKAFKDEVDVVRAGAADEKDYLSPVLGMFEKIRDVLAEINSISGNFGNIHFSIDRENLENLTQAASVMSFITTNNSNNTSSNSSDNKILNQNNDNIINDQKNINNELEEQLTNVEQVTVAINKESKAVQELYKKFTNARSMAKATEAYMEELGEDAIETTEFRRMFDEAFEEIYNVYKDKINPLDFADIANMSDSKLLEISKNLLGNTQAQNQSTSDILDNLNKMVTTAERLERPIESQTRNIERQEKIIERASKKGKLASTSLYGDERKLPVTDRVYSSLFQMANVRDTVKEDDSKTVKMQQANKEIANQVLKLIKSYTETGEKTYLENIKQLVASSTMPGKTKSSIKKSIEEIQKAAIQKVDEVVSETKKTETPKKMKTISLNKGQYKEWYWQNGPFSDKSTYDSNFNKHWEGLVKEGKAKKGGGKYGNAWTIQVQVEDTGTETVVQNLDKVKKKEEQITKQSVEASKKKVDAKQKEVAVSKQATSNSDNAISEENKALIKEADSITNNIRQKKLAKVSNEELADSYKRLVEITNSLKGKISDDRYAAFVNNNEIIQKEIAKRESNKEKEPVKEINKYAEKTNEELQNSIKYEEKWLERCKEGSEAYKKRKQTIEEIEKELVSRVAKQQPKVSDVSSNTNKPKDYSSILSSLQERFDTEGYNPKKLQEIHTEIKNIQNEIDITNEHFAEFADLAMQTKNALNKMGYGWVEGEWREMPELKEILADQEKSIESGERSQVQKEVKENLEETSKFAGKTNEELQQCLANEEKWLAKCKDGSDAYNRRKANIEEINALLSASTKENQNNVVVTEQLYDTLGRKIDSNNSKLLEGTKLIDEATGRIKVLYHGSNYEFDKFDPTLFGKNGARFGGGAYFSFDEPYAKAHGNKVGEWFANVTKIYDDRERLSEEELTEIYNKYKDKLQYLYSDLNTFIKEISKEDPLEQLRILGQKITKEDHGTSILKELGYQGRQFQLGGEGGVVIFDVDNLVKAKNVLADIKKNVGLKNNALSFLSNENNLSLGSEDVKKEINNTIEDVSKLQIAIKDALGSQYAVDSSTNPLISFIREVKENSLSIDDALERVRELKKFYDLANQNTPNEFLSNQRGMAKQEEMFDAITKGSKTAEDAYKDFISEFKNGSEYLGNEGKLTTIVSDSLGKLSNDYRRLQGVIADTSESTNSFEKAINQEAQHSLKILEQFFKEKNAIYDANTGIWKQRSNETASLSSGATTLPSTLQDTQEELKEAGQAGKTAGEHIAEGMQEASEAINQIPKGLIATKKSINDVSDLLAQKFYRGIDDISHGILSDKGQTFFDSNVDIGHMFEGQNGGLFSALLKYKNPFILDANGAKWDHITYLGDGIEEESKKITSVYNELYDSIEKIQQLLSKNGINNGDIVGLRLFDTFIGSAERSDEAFNDLFINVLNGIQTLEQNSGQDLSTIKELLGSLKEVALLYKTLGNDSHNMYGTHTTDEFSRRAIKNGYDGFIAQNVVETNGKTFESSTIATVVTKEQIENEEQLNYQLHLEQQQIDDINTELQHKRQLLEQEEKNLKELIDLRDKGNIKGNELQDANNVITNTQKYISSLKTQILELENKIGNLTNKTPALFISDDVKEKVKEDSEELVKTAQQATADAQKSSSPSKVAMKLGEYWGIGYAEGIKLHKKDVEDNIRELVNNGTLTAKDLIDSNLEKELRPAATNILESIKQYPEEQLESGFQRIKKKLGEYGNFNLSKKEDKQVLHDLVDQYIKYQNHGGKRYINELTDNKKALEKITKEYEKQIGLKKEILDVTEEEERLVLSGDRTESAGLLSPEELKKELAIADELSGKVLTPDDLVNNLDKVLEKIKELGLSAKDLRQAIDLLKGGDASFSFIDSKGNDQYDKISKLIKLLKQLGLEVNAIDDSEAWRFDISTQTQAQVKAAKESAKAVKEEGESADKAEKSFKKASNSKKEFKNRNKEVKDSAAESAEAILDEAKAAAEAEGAFNGDGLYRNQKGIVGDGAWSYEEDLGYGQTKKYQMYDDLEVSSSIKTDFEKLSNIIYSLDKGILQLRHDIAEMDGRVDTTHAQNQLNEMLTILDEAETRMTTYLNSPDYVPSTGHSQKFSQERNRRLTIESERLAQKAQTSYDKDQLAAIEQNNKRDAQEATRYNKEVLNSYNKLSSSIEDYIRLKIKNSSIGLTDTVEIDKLNSLEKTFYDAASGSEEFSANVKGAADQLQRISEERNTISSFLNDFNEALAGHPNNNNNSILKNLGIEFAEKYAKELPSLERIFNKGRLTENLSSELNEIIVTIREINRNGLDLNTKKGIDDVQKLESLLQDFHSKNKLSEYIKATENQVEKLRLKIANFTEINSGMGNKFKKQFDELFSVLSSDGEKSIETIQELSTAFVALEAEVTKAGKLGKGAWRSFKDAIATQTTQFLARYFSLQDMIRYARTAFETIHQLDTALVDLKKTTTMSNSDLEEFYLNSAKIAKQTGVTTQEIISQAAAWSRLGYSSKEAAESMSELSSKFAKISPGTSVEDATDYLVSTMKAFHIDVADVESEIMDSINRIGKLLPKHTVMYGAIGSIAQLITISVKT